MQVRTVVEWYMEGLHWVMQYYYRGVPSWSWFYPFHYAPFLSDMKDLQSIKCEFIQSEPVKAFQQVRYAAPVFRCNLLAPQCMCTKASSCRHGLLVAIPYAASRGGVQQ